MSTPGPGPDETAPGGPAAPDGGGAGAAAGDTAEPAGDATRGTVRPIDSELALEDAKLLTADLNDQLRRTLADLDNLRKRFAREVARERAAQRAAATAAWLPVVDDLERALQHAEADPGSLKEGVRAVYEHAQAVLDRLGYPRFEDVGEHFDPARHEAVSAVESDEIPAGKVVAAVRPGYGTAGEVLRPAGVVVARGRD